MSLNNIYILTKFKLLVRKIKYFKILGSNQFLQKVLLNFLIHFLINPGKFMSIMQFKYSLFNG